MRFLLMLLLLMAALPPLARADDDTSADEQFFNNVNQQAWDYCDAKAAQRKHSKRGDPSNGIDFDCLHRVDPMIKAGKKPADFDQVMKRPTFTDADKMRAYCGNHPTPKVGGTLRDLAYCFPSLTEQAQVTRDYGVATLYLACDDRRCFDVDVHDTSVVAWSKH